MDGAETNTLIVVGHGFDEFRESDWPQLSQKLGCLAPEFLSVIFQPRAEDLFDLGRFPINAPSREGRLQADWTFLVVQRKRRP